MTSENRILKLRLAAPVGPVIATLDVVASHGYDTDIILKRCGITRSQLADLSNEVTNEQYYAFNRYLIENTDIRGLGLLIGSAEKLSDYGFLGHAVSACENLRTALKIFDKYRLLTGPNNQHRSEVHDTYVALVCEAIGAPMPNEWSVELILSNFAVFLRSLLPEHASFLSVRMVYPAPEHAEMYEEVFGCPAMFGQKRNELRFDRSLLDVPFTSANAGLCKLCLRECDKMLEGVSPDIRLVEQVEAVIRSSLSSNPKFHLVAETLNMSARTLQRRLNDAGITYREIVENVRKGQAQEYLIDFRLPPKQIASLLGYSEPASLFHAFQRWFGCSPSELLQTHDTI